ncbi:MAG TPA: hypothetical protein VMF50_12155 [Candidatus Binataceae bacterium]|nr:hypothetical protein [Candidatus Binataceae bacterium]
MPRKPFVVTISTPTGGGMPTATVAQGIAEPDLAHRFVLTQGTNLLAKNELNISVGINGLLMTSNTTSNSEVSTAVQNAASSVAAFVGLPPGISLGGQAGANPLFLGEEIRFPNLFPNQPQALQPVPSPLRPHPQKELGCPPAGMSYQYLVYPEDRPRTDQNETDPVFCNYMMHWRLSGRLDKNPVTDTKNAISTHDMSGLFFRHELPYQVDITAGAAFQGSISGDKLTVDPDTLTSGVISIGQAITDPAGRVQLGTTIIGGSGTTWTVSVQQSVLDEPMFSVGAAANAAFTSRYALTSPDESEIDFFPVNHSFFADNTANITITDGVITSIDQTKDGELAAFVGLPATFVSSYTTAVGQLLTGITNNSSEQQKLIQQIQSTTLTQVQGAAIAQAEAQVCRKTAASYNFATMNAAQAAAATAAIQAACSSSNNTSSSSSNNSGGQ